MKYTSVETSHPISGQYTQTSTLSIWHHLQRNLHMGICNFFVHRRWEWNHLSYPPTEEWITNKFNINYLKGCHYTCLCYRVNQELYHSVFLFSSDSDKNTLVSPLCHISYHVVHSGNLYMILRKILNQVKHLSLRK